MTEPNWRGRGAEVSFLLSMMVGFEPAFLCMDGCINHLTTGFSRVDDKFRYHLRSCMLNLNGSKIKLNRAFM